MTNFSAQHKLEFMVTKDNIFASQNAQEVRLGNSIDSWYKLHSVLVEERAAHTLTQQKLADRLSITQPAVSVFENSNTLATQIGTIISYAAALGLEVEFSLKKAEYPNLPER